MSQRKENEVSVMNFQIQYFPRESKKKIEEVAAANGKRVKEFMISICDNAQEVFNFLREKHKI